MVRLVDLVRALFSGVARSKLSVVGAIIACILFPVLLISIALDMQGVISNPYYGFLIYMVMGPVFFVSLIMVLGGLFRRKGSEDIGLFTLEYLREQFSLPGRFSRIRRLILLSSILTIFTILLVGIVSYSGFHYTESVSFCAQFCHQVMNPEYVTYQNSPHSRVSCVECHIGQSSGWFTKAKISGLRQLVATVLNSYERPIKTPIVGLRPQRGVCEECHRPEMFHGDKLFIKDKYLHDQSNTHVQNVLLMRIGAGGYGGRAAHGIHWHVSPNHRITYTYSDRERQKIVRLKLEDLDSNSAIIYKLQGQEWKPTKDAGVRVMDCMDCHNRPTHIYLSPDEALDQKITAGLIPKDIPFIKRQALAVITKEFGSDAQARASISLELRIWYQENYPEYSSSKAQTLNKAIDGVIQAYVENVFPQMRVGWGTYESFIGHDGGGGCFRCHGSGLITKDGRSINQDCNICHVVLAENEQAPDMVKLIKGIDR